MKARVLGLDQCSGVAVCTLHKSLVSGINKMDQLTIGEKINFQKWKENMKKKKMGGNINSRLKLLSLEIYETFYF